MRRMIVSDDYDFMGAGIVYRENKAKYMRDPELREAFEAGCEHGYRKAQEEMGYNERRYDDRGRVLYREHDYDDDYMERRRRDSRGRYM